MATVAIVIFKKEVAEDGMTPVYLRFTHGGKPRYHSLKHRVLAEKFAPDPKSGTFLLPSAPHAARMNYLLSMELQNARKTMLDMEIAKVVLNFDNFMARFRPLSEKKFSAWAMETVSQEEADMELSEGAARVYRSAIKKFVKIVGDVKIVDIDSDVIKKFKEKVLGMNSENTANTYLRSLHRFYANLVDNHNVTDSKPFKSVTMESILPEKKEVLSPAEESRLINYLDEYLAGNVNDFSEKCYNDLTKYCFCLHTGLRHSDVDDLKFSHLHAETMDGNEVWFIHKIRIKGSKRLKAKKKWLLVPLVPNALKLIDWQRNASKDSPVFEPSHYRTFNANLNKVAALLGIEKYITTHTARHTFSERLLEHGKSDGDIARLLGNTKEVTRTYYAQGTKLALLNMITTNQDEMRKPTQYPDVTHSRTNTLRLNMIALRKKRGKEPVDMCKLIGSEGISLPQYTRYESGETQMSIKYVIDFCRIFGITLSDLEKGNF